jgi:GNAT superfamily N-acetyltransferase
VIHTATIADLDRLRALLASANDAPYDLARVAEEKCFGAGSAGAPVVRVWGDFEGVAVTCGRSLRILAVDRARRRRGIGSALFADADSLGARIAAAEPGNYFIPGVLDPSFLQHRGWNEVSRTQNLVTDELPDAIPSGVQRATHDDRERVLDFIHREFGRLWAFEAAKAFDIATPTLFFSESNGVIEGFSAHECNNRGLGFFGPTGVAHAARGRGVGHRLLRASLADLRRLGYNRAIIAWTDALEYYRKGCNARVESRFVIACAP